MLTKLFDNSQPASLSNRFRRKRTGVFLKMISDLPKPVKILDAGGTELYWQMMGLAGKEEFQFTLVNTERINTTFPNFRFVEADSRNLSMFSDKEFDIVFSNSVIEHVGGFEEQKKMANEIMRAGKMYFVQTPNYYFPFEPHFMFPFFQFLPVSLKIFLVSKFNMGWYKKSTSKKEAEIIVKSINLLKKKELMRLFPGSGIIKERFLFLVKSYIIYII